ncbi:E3 ubiquitin-protein ligase RNFT2 isoform X5 [Dasypus novemcinctus]|uniref:E3 ubiquitin-protein ligase RNFT2 isoform X5 n=1 Tax=Dasypus novemcinctus TaxID=9361 RepID=UPI00265DEBF8|nr:RING finger and transmembrane domain-containing protein 2 isoform X5 [Dasypus novemcinctus]
MWLLTLNQVLRKMQRRHSSNTENVPPERNRSQVLSPEASVDEGGVFGSLKAEAASPPALFSGLAGLPAGSLPATPFPAGLVLGSAAGGGDVFLQMPASREEGAGRGEGGAFHHRAPHHFHHGAPRGASLLQHVGADPRAHADDGPDEPPGTPAPALSELKAVVCWLQKGLPFILILLAKVCFQHKLGIAVCIGMASTFAYANSTLREQVSLKEKRSVLVILWILAFLAGNTLYVLYTFSSQQLYNSLIFLKPNLETLDFFDLLWIVGIADFVLKYITIALKCLVVALPKIILAVKSKAAPDTDCGTFQSGREALNLLHHLSSLVYCISYCLSSVSLFVVSSCCSSMPTWASTPVQASTPTWASIPTWASMPTWASTPRGPGQLTTRPVCLHQEAPGIKPQISYMADRRPIA